MYYPVDWQEELARKPICGVLAVAVVANITFAEATDLVKKHMLPHQKRHGGKTYAEQRYGALNDCGVKYMPLNVKRQTLLRFLRENPEGTYMIEVTGHVVVYKDGLVIDQSQIANVEEHWAKRKFIIEVFEIAD